MVDEVELAKIDAIDNAKKLETYLKDNPIEWSQLIALRIALRVFPLVAAPTDWATDNPRDYKQICLSVWCAIHISALVPIRPNSDMRASARTASTSVAASAASAYAAAAAASASAFAASAAAAAAYAARASASAASAASASAASAASAADAAADAARASASAADAAADAAGADIWISVRNDLYLLNNGEDLLRTELYQYVGNGASDNRAVMMQSWHRSGVLDFAELPMVKDRPWQIISDWYLSLIDSDFHSTPWGSFGSDEDFEVALKPDDFWRRDPDDVMAGIAEIVGWPEYGQSVASTVKMGDLEMLIEAQRTISDKLSIYCRKHNENKLASLYYEYKEELIPIKNKISSQKLIELYFELSELIEFDPDKNEDKFKGDLIAFDQLHKEILNIISASIGAPNSVQSYEESLEKIVESSSPDFGYDRRNQFGPIQNAVYDQKTPDNSIFELTKMQIVVVGNIIEVLPDNAPKVIEVTLKIYQTELVEKDVRFVPGILRQAAKSVLSSYDEKDLGNWCDAGTMSLFESFSENHNNLLKLVPKHDEYVKRLQSINLEADEKLLSELQDAMAPLLSLLPELVENGVVNKEFEILIMFVSEQLKNALDDVQKGKVGTKELPPWLYGMAEKMKQAGGKTAGLAKWIKDIKPLTDVLEEFFKNPPPT